MLIPLLAFSFVSFLKGLLLLLFILSALLLTLVVLLQEPKGGGLSSAFGGAGAETFGVQTGSVNKFTAWVAAVFMATGLLYAAIRPPEAPTILDTEPPGIEEPAAPLESAPGGAPEGGAGAETGGEAPAGGGEQR